MTVVLATHRMLKLLSNIADTPAMLSPTLQFDVTPAQQQLLHAYQAQAASLKVTSEEFDGWLERIDELSGVEVDQLTSLHGQLIAAGMLRFEISGRNVGLKYQLSQQGKRALELEAESDEGREDDELAEFEAESVAAEISSDQPFELIKTSDSDSQDRSISDHHAADAA